MQSIWQIGFFNLNSNAYLEWLFKLFGQTNSSRPTTLCKRWQINKFQKLLITSKVDSRDLLAFALKTLKIFQDNDERHPCTSAETRLQELLNTGTESSRLILDDQSCVTDDIGYDSIHRKCFRAIHFRRCCSNRGDEPRDTRARYNKKSIRCYVQYRTRWNAWGDQPGVKVEKERSWTARSETRHVSLTCRRRSVTRLRSRW